VASATYARGGQDQTTAGGAIIVAVSVLSALLLIAALAYAAGTGGRHNAALAAAGCEPNLSHSGLPCTAVQMLARQYAAIVTPAAQQLSTAAADYTAHEMHHLVLAVAALRAELASENALGASLARFPFPPAVAPAARVLIKDNQVSAALTAEQARSTSLRQLRSFNARVQAASAAVSREMALVGTALAIRPTASQEP
jgi:hypothetical protein